jgi:UDP-N-acetylglucosamine 2-epimerase
MRPSAQIRHRFHPNDIPPASRLAIGLRPLLAAKMTVLLLATPEGAEACKALAGHLDDRRVSELAPARKGDAPIRMAAAILAGEELLAEDPPEALVLCGEGPEVAATALVAVKLEIPQARVGAGARDGNRRDPAEIDRGVADRLCDLLLCDDDVALANLRREGIADRALVVGDVRDDPAPAAAAIRGWLAS